MAAKGRPVRRRLVFTLAMAAFIGLAAGRGARAQFPSNNVSLYSHVNLTTLGASAGNDCWGYVSPAGREYALMSVNNKLAFVEITIPTAPVIVATIPHTSSTWGDVKVYQHVAYAVTEASGSGIQVIDMSNIDSGTVSLVRTITSPGRSHNVALDTDSGFLYTCGSRGGAGTTVIFDLSNPTNPVQVGTWTGAYQHDAQIVTYTSGPYAGRQILFGASEGRGVDIVDVTNKSNTFLISRTPYTNVAYCHQLWTEDLRYLYINDELDSIPRTIVYDITNLNNPNVVRIFTTGVPTIDHNLYVRGNYLFEANYTSGLHIFDIIDPVNPVHIGFFDTFPSSNAVDFDGAWSVYPFFPSGTIIVSDISGGLFVLSSPMTLPKLVFNAPNGLPRWVSTDGGTAVRIEVVGRDLTPQPGTGMLHYDTGGGFVSVAMEQVSPNVYDAVFPAVPCLDLIDFYFSAQETGGATLTDPQDAPTSVHATVSARGIANMFTDNFETNRGWTVENVLLLDGAWERGLPIGGGDRGDPATDFDGSGQCFLTDNVDDDSDVDGGPTRLVSPNIDLTTTIDPTLTYARWFTNNPVDEDRLDVEISDDGGATWTLIESVAHRSTWIERSVRIGDHVGLTSQVRLRFGATDNPNNSITEAAIDAVAIRDFTCVAPLVCAKGDVNEDQVVDGRDVSLFAANLISGGTPGTVAFCATDMDDDGTLELGDDLASFVDCLVSGICP